MKNILMVFGTRPEAIKMAPLILSLKRVSGLKVTICVTGQHRQMLDQVLSVFRITPDIDLDLMVHDQTLSGLTCLVLNGLQQVLKNVSPSIVCVHGDTTTAMVSAMAAFYESIPVAHVEAGLRSHNILRPFPEEFNRSIIGKIATLHFAPTKEAFDNLIAENVASKDIWITGNTVVDAVKWVTTRLDNDTEWASEIHGEICKLLRYSSPETRIVLITAHRRENFGSGFREICAAIERLAKKYPNVNFVYPVHQNPTVASTVKLLLDGIENIFLLEPLSYENFICLMKRSYLILTDSGGIQEEAPGMGKPTLVMRSETERLEALSTGVSRLVGAQCAAIVDGVSILLDDDEEYLSMSNAPNPYGDGDAAEKIREIVCDFIDREHIDD